MTEQKGEEKKGKVDRRNAGSQVSEDDGINENKDRHSAISDPLSRVPQGKLVSTAVEANNIS